MNDTNERLASVEKSISYLKIGLGLFIVLSIIIVGLNLFIQPNYIPIISAIVGSLITASVVFITWWLNVRANTARELVAEALRIQALKESWILEGPQYKDAVISENEGLSEELQDDQFYWLRRVEIRTILDNAIWNAPKNKFYRILEGTRIWIVRDKVENEASYNYKFSGFVDPHPAVISSHGIEEICGWIERIAIFYFSSKFFSRVSDQGYRMLRPMLRSLDGEDRVKAIEDRLTDRAKQFLRWHRNKYPDI